jgi:hypothetical protein
VFLVAEDGERKPVVLSDRLSHCNIYNDALGLVSLSGYTKACEVELCML